MTDWKALCAELRQEFASLYSDMSARVDFNEAYADRVDTLLTRARTARRPKPPTLKEQALEALQFVDEKLDLPLHNHCNAIYTIRRALEALPDD